MQTESTPPTENTHCLAASSTEPLFFVKNQLNRAPPTSRSSRLRLPLRSVRSKPGDRRGTSTFACKNARPVSLPGWTDQDERPIQGQGGPTRALATGGKGQGLPGSIGRDCSHQALSSRGRAETWCSTTRLLPVVETWFWN